MSDITNILKSVLDKKADECLAIDGNVGDIAYYVPTGLIPLDSRLGGGIPSGRIIELLGVRSSGKSTLLDTINAAWTSHDKNAVILRVESESTLDTYRASVIGVDLNRLIITETNCLEEGFLWIKKKIKAIKEALPEAKILIEWDSLSAAAPKSELEGDQFHSGRQYTPRLLKAEFRNLSALLRETDSTFIFISQVVQAGTDQYGNMRYSSGGGEAVKHYMSVSIETKRSQPILSGDGSKDIEGNWTDFKFIKNKVTGDESTCTCALDRLYGFDKAKTNAVFFMRNAEAAKLAEVKGGGNITIFNHKGEEYCKVRGSGKVAELMKTDKYLQKLVEYLSYKLFIIKDENFYGPKYGKIIETLEKELEKLFKESKETAASEEKTFSEEEKSNN